MQDTRDNTDTQRRIANILARYPASTWDVDESRTVLLAVVAVVALGTVSRSPSALVATAAGIAITAGVGAIHEHMRALLAQHPAAQWKAEQSAIVYEALCTLVRGRQKASDVVDLRGWRALREPAGQLGDELVV